MNVGVAPGGPLGVALAVGSVVVAGSVLDYHTFRVAGRQEASLVNVVHRKSADVGLADVMAGVRSGVGVASAPSRAPPSWLRAPLVLPPPTCVPDPTRRTCSRMCSLVTAPAATSECSAASAVVAPSSSFRIASRPTGSRGYFRGRPGPRPGTLGPRRDSYALEGGFGAPAGH